MEHNLIDAAVHLSYDLTGRTVGILVIGQQKGQIGMPQIALKPIPGRDLQQFIDALEEEASQILLIIESVLVILHQKGHIQQDIPMFHIFIKHQFIRTHILFLIIYSWPVSITPAAGGSVMGCPFGMDSLHCCFINNSPGSSG